MFIVSSSLINYPNLKGYSCFQARSTVMAAPRESIATAITASASTAMDQRATAIVTKENASHFSTVSTVGLVTDLCSIINYFCCSSLMTSFTV